MPVVLPFADSTDIVRATSKDEEYITLFESSIREFLLCTLPNSTTSSPTATRLISTLARLIYYATPLHRTLPTTPGEEYAAVVPVHTTSTRTALPGARILLALALSRVLNAGDVRQGLRVGWGLLGDRAGSFPRETVGRLLDVTGRLHTALFYMYGRFQEAGHRLANLRYVRIAPRVGGASSGRLRLLGWLVVLQVGLEVGKGVRRAVVRARRRAGCDGGWVEFVRRVGVEMVRKEVEDEDEEGEEGEEGEGQKCILCLGVMKNATLTGCGHVFCWKCICSWCSSNVSFRESFKVEARELRVKRDR